MPQDMVMVWDYLIGKKQVQKKNFDKSHGLRPLLTLDPGQKVLFLSPADYQSYVCSTILGRFPPPKLCDQCPGQAVLQIQGAHSPNTTGSLQSPHFPAAGDPPNLPASQSPIPKSSLEHFPNSLKTFPHHSLQ